MKQYDPKYDAYYDSETNDWLEEACENLDCSYCAGRPPKHVGETPYLETRKVVVERAYNPKYGDDRICICGHPYHRHFDSYEQMSPIGCKYCECRTFQEAVPI